MRVCFGLVSLAFLAVSCGGDDSSSDGAADPALREVSYQCLKSDNELCAASANGKTVRASWFQGECVSFSSSTDILSLGTVEAECDDDTGCKSSARYFSNWSKASLPAGDYGIYVFIDLDDNNLPIDEPKGCVQATHRTDSRPNVDLE